MGSFKVTEETQSTVLCLKTFVRKKKINIDWIKKKRNIYGSPKKKTNNFKFVEGRDPI